MYSKEQGGMVVSCMKRQRNLAGKQTANVTTLIFHLFIKVKHHYFHIQLVVTEAEYALPIQGNRFCRAYLSWHDNCLRQFSFAACVL